jgi:subtilase family serine protease
VDLTVASVKAKGKAAAGASVAVKYTVANSGSTASAATTTQVFLSSNATWDAGDTPVGSDGTLAVPAGGSISDTVTANIPGGTNPGVYYLIVFADAPNGQPETNETNNTRAKKISIGPDLVISALSINPGSVAAGGSITINETTKNTGAQTTGVPSTTTWYLSVDKKVNAGDTVLGTHAVPTLGPNGTNAKSQLVTIPAGRPPGQYWIIAAADSANAIAEVKETNTKVVALTIF